MQCERDLLSQEKCNSNENEEILEIACKGWNFNVFIKFARNENFINVFLKNCYKNKKILIFF